LDTDSGEQLGRFDWVITTAPAAQTAALLPASTPIQASIQTQMSGCCALMLGFAEPSIPQLSWQAALVREADISWVSVNSSKPGRAAACSVVVHSTNAYAEASLDDAPASVQAHMLNELQAVTGIDPALAEHCTLHRWRYANTPQQEGPPALVDPSNKLGACGDWLIHGRVEAAFLSAKELAASVRELL
ncbi:MAG: hypothetical protein P8R04_03580, partial [Gammaproteobacteria bacterium]|nr:hypothetical protein [Gammaproteobacteria bacterium]